MSRLKFIEVNFHCHADMDSPEAVIEKHRQPNLYISELKKEAEIVLVKHLHYDGERILDGIRYRFFERPNRFWNIPGRTLRFIAAEKPDIVLVRGFIFPLQVMALRRKLGPAPVILLQHQADHPFRRKKIIQQWADRSVNGYLFSALEMEDPWIKAGIIRNRNKCFVCPPASSQFERKDKSESRLKTGLGEGKQFLWVGRLNANKDPFTVLAAFEKYFEGRPDENLYMIFQEIDLLEVVQQRIRQHPLLSKQVLLIGKKDHAALEDWYNSADYFISASHYESFGFAPMEAIACGCVPILSNIPASIQLIQRGRLGYAFEKGSSGDLYKVLCALDHTDHPGRSAACREFFSKELSPTAIASRLLQIAGSLKTK
ncbi:MAG: glycosyltransferase family 4 protein [Chitinophagaceae bacterium]|nr:glycosyltransferase family 4 protein [Chitinophagaceae bacterium]